MKSGKKNSNTRLDHVKNGSDTSQNIDSIINQTEKDLDILKSNQSGSRGRSVGRGRNRGRIGRRTKDMVDIAKERIRILLNLGEREILDNNNYARARRYVELARKIGMRYNIRLGKNYRGKICRKCNSYLITSTSARVRCHGGRIIIVCKQCGNIIRVPVHFNKKGELSQKSNKK
jgi:ribonuclease P protein subunit RPR2